jgi:hypothetical protein
MWSFFFNFGITVKYFKDSLTSLTISEKLKLNLTGAGFLYTQSSKYKF